jgi:Spy/CpxP family protein refolding chaperone
MARHIAWAFAALLLSPARSPAAGLCVHEQATQQRGVSPEHQKGDKPGEQGHQPPKKWWIEPAFRAELGITDQQSAAIEAIWQKGLPDRTAARDQFEKLDAVLSKMILDGADEAAVTAQLDRVEVARSDANKARVLMLYRMNKVLTQEQRAKLDAKVKAMREQRDGGRRGGPPSR